MKNARSRNGEGLLPLLLFGSAGFLFWSLRRRARRIDFFGKTVVIAGGSRGLGLELARQLAREGARLVLLARNTAELVSARHSGWESGSPLAPSILTRLSDIAVERHNERPPGAQPMLRRAKER